MNGFPVDNVLPQLLDALATPGITILEAPPGAGKTTRVPPYLLKRASWLREKKIIMLEPRRLAAKRAAAFMADQMRERPGETIGYQVRLEHAIGPATRIEVVTEGLLTRKLQEDPSLAAYGLVIFDEIHERSLDSELALALCRDSLAALRPDLRLVLMSATLNSTSMAKTLGADVVVAEGKNYPVETEFMASRSLTGLPAAAVSAICSILPRSKGDLLVFLPGMREIDRTQRLLENRLSVFPAIHTARLHGSATLLEQREAIAPAKSGQRKIVLSSAIAESSLTIEGVRVVIDGGWMRIAKFSPRTGMARLETVRVTRDSADQRRGRAGRVAPGRCIRLWTQHEDNGLVESRTPEIEEADLAPLALQLALWGARAPSELEWLTPPPAAQFQTATDLLQMLDAVDAEGQITARGKKLSQMPMHPRLAHMIEKGREHGNGNLAKLLAATLSDRDPLARGHNIGADLARRVDLIVRPDDRIAGSIRHRILKLARSWGMRALPTAQTRDRDLGILLASAFPDRIGRRRGASPTDYLLSNGRGARLYPDDPLCGAEWVVAVHLNDRGADAIIHSGCELAADAIKDLDLSMIRERCVEWDDTQARVLAYDRERLGAIELNRQPARGVTAEETARALEAVILKRGLACLNWSPKEQQWVARVQLMRKLFPDEGWPDTSDKGLRANATTWLLPLLFPVRSLAAAQKLPLYPGLFALLDYEKQKKLEKDAPERITVPSGSKIRVDYTAGETPALAVQIQECFGLKQTPTLARGRVPVLMHLLSPAGRPVQITQDLKGFWQTGYAEARKELRGRYPKHAWPETPADGVASRHTPKRLAMLKRQKRNEKKRST